MRHPLTENNTGMRATAQILIFIDVQKALDAGIPFHLSENGVVLTEGDASGFLSPQFFQRVEYTNRVPVPGWEGSGRATPYLVRADNGIVEAGEGASEEQIPAHTTTESTNTTTPS